MRALPLSVGIGAGAAAHHTAAAAATAATSHTHTQATPVFLPRPQRLRPAVALVALAASENLHGHHHAAVAARASRFGHSHGQRVFDVDDSSVGSPCSFSGLSLSDEISRPTSRASSGSVSSLGGLVIGGGAKSHNVFDHDTGHLDVMRTGLRSWSPAWGEIGFAVTAGDTSSSSSISSSSRGASAAVGTDSRSPPPSVPCTNNMGGAGGYDFTSRTGGAAGGVFSFDDAVDTDF
jgi:hypothetical protein